MPRLEGFVDFDPEKEIPSLDGRVVFITGGTAGLGRESVGLLAQHDPSHIYFTGRDVKAAESLIAEVKEKKPAVGLTFVALDMTSLASVKAAVAANFSHDRLDLLMCNAGVMALPAGLSKDGFEIQFAINHLAHAMIIQQLLPMLDRTAEQPDSDVRVVCLTSTGWRGHPRQGIEFDKVRTTQEGLAGSWVRYGQSKLANVIYASELARRHPHILSVSLHPGVIKTGLVSSLPVAKRKFVEWSIKVTGDAFTSPDKGAYNQIWAATYKRSDMSNGSFYMPIGVLSDKMFDKAAKSEELAKKLWEWTDEVLAEY
ncbi:putative short-chain dehydrogenase [Lasiosphaeria miniovina]|uniref:Short-chain dehydrogenase n=1 Tax=Lasiosphaeria miniovina TaxID=1954250 RepID=A0AA40B6G4_9PEZI|nr:putative short-chain dehydrogenase [Lasiosphaeria miniovina]KAK0728439.1 putative short-chain dehydrogenase [Lasiosphaeria miniovina]